MSRKPIIAGNWKMHGSRDSVIRLLNELKNNFNHHQEVDVVVFPPAIFLHETEQQLTHTVFQWGAQNCSDKESGAFTGEISVAMLKDYGCRYVIVGHSERRHLYHEDNQMVAQKFLCALTARLCPILCVGESEAERIGGKTLSVVSSQLAAALDLVDNLDTFKQFIIAYEPVWAIGTGQVATPKQAEAVHLAIREQLASYNDQLAKQVRIVYGGSVNSSNAASLFAEPNIDGGLVGGASLNAQQFIEIIQKCHK